jgi:hypothetical protein
MPRYNPETAKRRAMALVKPLLANGFNERKTGDQLGVTRQAINQRINRKPVQDILQKFLSSKKLKKVLIETAIDGIQADKSISAAILVQKNGTVVKADDHGGIMVKDHHARHKYWHDLMTATGVLKINGEGNGVRIVNIIYGYRANRTEPVDSSVRST